MADITVIRKALTEYENGRELAIATITRAEGSTPRGVGSVMVVFEDGEIYGTVGGGAIEKHIIDLSLNAIKEGESKLVDIPLNTKGVEMVCGGEVTVFIDVYKIKPKLIIVGGGHVGHAIYKIASVLDFDIIVFEDREEFLYEERFPFAKELVLGNPKETLKEYKIDKNTYIIIATRGHKYDEEALESCLDTDAAYIGAMGSKTKILAMRGSLKKKGIAEEKLDNIYAPIGLDISSESPEEIAMSILAEILLVKNDGTLSHMRNSIR